jgi:hypothetical protein
MMRACAAGNQLKDDCAGGKVKLVRRNIGESERLRGVAIEGSLAHAHDIRFRFWPSFRFVVNVALK